MCRVKRKRMAERKVRIEAMEASVVRSVGVRVEGELSAIVISFGNRG